MPAAQPGEFGAVHVGALLVSPPVVLAPMAGITNHLSFVFITSLHYAATLNARE